MASCFKAAAGTSRTAKKYSRKCFQIDCFKYCNTHYTDIILDNDVYALQIFFFFEF